MRTALGALASGAFRDRQVALVWPTDSSGIGNFAFSVTLDAEGTIFENNAANTGETNNSATLSVTSAPDLVVDQLAVTPADAESGAAVTVT